MYLFKTRQSREIHFGKKYLVISVLIFLLIVISIWGVKLGYFFNHKIDWKYSQFYELRGVLYHHVSNDVPICPPEMTYLWEKLNPYDLTYIHSESFTLTVTYMPMEEAKMMYPFLPDKVVWQPRIDMCEFHIGKCVTNTMFFVHWVFGDVSIFNFEGKVTDILHR